MRNPENNDKISDYSAADRAIMRASMNASRLANKKGSAKKVVKKATPKPKNAAGSMAYTPGSTKKNKATYTTGSGVKYKGAAAKPASKPASKGMSGSSKAKIIGGALLAGGAIAAKATGPGKLATAAFGLGRGIAGAMGRKTATKALSTSGKITAKAGKSVTQAQYDAMKKVASKAPKKLVKTKATATGAGAASMVPNKKK